LREERLKRRKKNQHNKKEKKKTREKERAKYYKLRQGVKLFAFIIIT